MIRPLCGHYHGTIGVKNRPLLVFHLADGMTFLKTKKRIDNLPEWSDFICLLYDQIMANHYKPGKVSFVPELSKVQLLQFKNNTI